MTFKTILAVIGARDAATDVDKAIDLAREHDAHLSVLVVGAALQPVMADYPVAAAWLDQRQKDIDDLLDVHHDAEHRCRKNGISFDIDSMFDDRFILESNIGARAMYADLVLLGNGVRGDKGLRKSVMAGAAFNAGTPLLLLPQTGGASLTPKTVLLAWNSRPEAARAAKAALNMLVAAAVVHVVLVDPDSSYFGNGGEPGADIAAFLARHGVRVMVEQVTSSGRDVEAVLTQHGREIGCDMIVMGAYGHSRLRESIFGGVTASILDACPLPVFLAR